MKNIFKEFSLVFVLIFLTQPCFANNVNFQATVDSKRITMDSALRLSLTITNADAAATSLPEIDGFESRYVGPSTQVSIVNGQMTKNITHNYSLFPTKIGTFTIPAFSMEIDGKTLTTNPISIEVVDSQTPGDTNSQATAPSSIEKIEDKIFFMLEVPLKDFYIGEKIPLTMRLFVRDVSVRDIELPELDKKNLIFDEYRQPSQYQTVVQGLQYNVVEFKVDAYPTTTGPISLGPAILKANILYKTQNQRRSAFDGFFGDSSFFDGFFDSYERRPFSVKSQPVSLNILSLPEEEKPVSFSGGVGRFDFKMTASPLELKVGDPITVVMNLSGEGNLKTIQLPAFKDTDDFKVYDPQIKEIDGVKVLEQVLIPKSQDLKEIPKVDFSYFDSSLRKYQTITQGPFNLKVQPSAEGEGFKIVETPDQKFMPLASQEEKLGRDLIFIKEKLGDVKIKNMDFYNSFFLKIFYVIITFLFFVFYAYFLVESHLKKDVALARKLSAPKKAKDGIKRMKQLMDKQQTKEYYDCLFKTIDEYFKDKFHLSSAVLTFSVLEKILEDKKIPAVIITRVRRMFEECDEVRFASATYAADKMKTSFDVCQEVIDYFERNVR